MYHAIESDSGDSHDSGVRRFDADALYPRDNFAMDTWRADVTDWKHAGVGQHPHVHVHVGRGDYRDVPGAGYRINSLSNLSQEAMKKPAIGRLFRIVRRYGIQDNERVGDKFSAQHMARVSE